MLGNAKLFLLAGAFVGTAGLMMAADIPNNFVALDGNSVVAPDTTCTASNTPSGCRDDWDLLNGDGTGAHPGAAGGSLARTFASGAASVAVFAGGGSKDPLDIPNWKWKSGGTPDKDAITNGYAAAYKAPISGHLILEFGADRFAVNGDANIGFWFFQQDVHPTGAGTGGGSPFSNGHSDGDLFVVSAFTQGGGVSTITVYSWASSCAKGVQNPGIGDCAESNLKLRFKSDPNAANCAVQPEGCAIVNSSPINVSWPYLAKFGSNVTSIPQGGFYEGGLDVNALLGDNILECFTSFLIETRTSATASSVLKDFISGNFNVCGLKATKTCPADGVLNADGTVHYSFNVAAQNTGIATLSNVTVVDTYPTTCSGSPATVTHQSITPSSVASLAAGDTTNFTVTFDFPCLTADNSAIVKASLSGGNPGLCGAAGTLCSSSSGAQCTATATNSISITKDCGIPIGHPGNVGGANPIPGVTLTTSASVQVNFSGQICNTGDTPLSNASIIDVPGATITPSSGISLAKSGAVGDCVNYSGYYNPTSASGLGLDPGRYGFADEIYVKGATAQLGNNPPVSTACKNMTGAPTDPQNCTGVTCHICTTSPDGQCNVPQ